MENETEVKWFVKKDGQFGKEIKSLRGIKKPSKAKLFQAAHQVMEELGIQEIEVGKGWFKDRNGRVVCYSVEQSFVLNKADVEKFLQNKRCKNENVNEV